MPSLSTTTFDHALKTLYSTEKVMYELYKDNPFLAMIAKKTDFGGKNKVVDVLHQGGGGGEHTFTTGQTNNANPTGQNFTVTRKSTYAVRQIDNEVIEASQYEPGILIDAIKMQAETAILRVKNKLAHGLFQDGSDALATINGAPASTTMTLTNADDIVHFFVGMVCVFAANTAGALRAGTLTVTAINEAAGTMTMSANINTVATDGDTVFQQGTYVNAADRNAIMGLGGWNPATAPTLGDSFFGADRSTNVTGLAGYRFTDAGAYAGYQEIDSIKLLARMIGRAGLGGDLTAFLNHERMDNLINQIEGKVIYDKTTIPITTAKGKVYAEAGFDAVRVHTPAGLVSVYADRSCGPKVLHVVKLDTLKLWTLGETVKWISDASGSKARTRESADGQEMRLVSRGNMVCHAPAGLARFDWT